MYTVFRTKTYVFAGNRSRISTAKGHAIAIVSTKQAHCTNMQHWPRRPQEELKKAVEMCSSGETGQREDFVLKGSHYILFFKIY